MEWYETLQEKFASGASHAFLLYLNVSDDFMLKSSAQQLRYALADSDLFYSFHFTLFANRGTGIQFPLPQIEEDFLNFLDMIWDHPMKALDGNLKYSDYFQAHRDEVPYMLGLISKLLPMSLAHSTEKEKRGLKKLEEKHPGRALLGAIIEFAETYVPPESAHDREEDRNALVTFLVWARDQKIHAAKNLVIFNSETLSGVAPAMRSEANRIIPIKIPFPNLQERQALLQAEYDKSPQLGMELSSCAAALLTSGMTSSILERTCREVIHKKIPLTAKEIFAHKQKAIHELSAGRLRIMKSQWGTEAIGELKLQIEYVLEVARNFKSGNISAVPQGMLWLGPQGVGKTVLAEALSYEMDIPFITIGNQREMWHGVSEQNLELDTEIIVANQPVIVFMDEFDQRFQKRGTISHGDSGVSARYTQKQLEVMSDTNLRGKVLWIAASNRPDEIDAAFLREGRFDIKIPFLPYGAAGRTQIAPAILRKLRIQYQAQGSDFHWELSDSFLVEFGVMTHRHIEGNKYERCSDKWLKKPDHDANEVPLTGAEIEFILAGASRLSVAAGRPLIEEDVRWAEDDFMLSRNHTDFMEFTRLALRYCNSKQFIPKGSKWEEMLGEQATSVSTPIVNTGQYL